MENNFMMELTACLNRAKSRRQLNSDIKEIEKAVNMLRITGIFAKGNTKKELNSYIKTLQSQLNHVKLTAKVDHKNVKDEVNRALNHVSFKDINLLDIDQGKAKLKIKKVLADIREYADKNPVRINMESKKNKLNDALTSFLNKNTKINESSVLLEEADKVRDLIGEIRDTKSLREAADAFRLYKSEVTATGFSSKTAADRVKGMLSWLGRIGEIFGVSSLAVSNFTKSLQTLKSNDTILTEIGKTSEMAKQQLKELGEEAFKTASRYGQTSSGYLLGVQAMAKAGYGGNAKNIAELSTKAQSSGGLTAELSNGYTAG